MGGQITPFASRTFQYTKEQLGQAEDKVRTVRGTPWVEIAVSNSDGNQTELPPDYIDLEKRVDALKAAHQKMLAVT